MVTLASMRIDLPVPQGLDRPAQVGDMIRSYDFCGRTDCYMEGLVTKVHEGLIHANTTAIRFGELGELAITLGDNDTFRTPELGLMLADKDFRRIIVLQTKTPAAACPRCYGWTSCGGMSQFSKGKAGCQCQIKVTNPGCFTQHIKLTPNSKALFTSLWEDKGNWAGQPLFQPKDPQKAKGNLCDLKRKGLVTAFVSDGCTFIDFTKAGEAYAKSIGLGD